MSAQEKNESITDVNPYQMVIEEKMMRGEKCKQELDLLQKQRELVLLKYNCSIRQKVSFEGTGFTVDELLTVLDRQ